jgi:hypothetical protein
MICTRGYIQYLLYRIDATVGKKAPTPITRPNRTESLQRPEDTGNVVANFIDAL